ncbi:hypothetical protein [Candidatus Poriferisodalis sp.]|uniref:hypothetical protein n=1 Tax=Candidatus Poriferisodalis sp. TaxID=3101277 RepID=UPI003B012A81
MTESEEDSTEWVLEINVNPDWAAELAEVQRFAVDCGYYTGYAECDDPEDTQTLEQMYSDFVGGGCDAYLGGGWDCRGMTRSEVNALVVSRACPKGWSIDSDELCFHPTHLNYSRDYAYHDPSEADPRGVRSNHWEQMSH